jgi:hypothetical protein
MPSAHSVAPSMDVSFLCVAAGCTDGFQTERPRLPFPVLPPISDQQKIVAQFDQSITARRIAVRALGDAEDQTAAIWPQMASAAVFEEEEEAAA